MISDESLGEAIDLARRDAVVEWLDDLMVRTTSLLDEVREAGSKQIDVLRGLYLDDAEADRIARSRRPAAAPPPRRLVGLDEIAARLGLDPVDLQILLVAAAPDLDRRYEQLFGYLNDDVTVRRATVALALRLSGLDVTDPGARRRLAPGSALVERGLVQVAEPERSHLSRSLIVPDRLVAFVLGDDRPNSALITIADQCSLPPSEFVDALSTSLASGTEFVYVRESGSPTAAWFASAAMTIATGRTVVADLGRGAVHEVIADACLEALVSDVGLVIGPVECLGDGRTDRLERLAALERPVVVYGRDRWDPDWAPSVPLTVEAPRLDAETQATLWRGALADGDLLGGELDPGAATAAFRLGPENIRRAARAATLAARHRGESIDADDLQVGARAQNAAGLQRLANRIEPEATWQHLVLPPGPTSSLRELSARVKHRSTVLDDWGLRRSGGRGDGLTAMFAGPSGTGKTLAAEVVAGDLGLDLHTVDVSTVVDKYIGETEKNLDRIFGEAEQVNTVIFFDEADALFGKRSEVKDARDRYANVEVAYLLQRMERFDGVAILATNLRLNIDDAFARRLDLVIDFPKPTVQERRRLWVVLSGERLPLGPDVDVDFLATRFELCGGDIRNAVTTAAYLAAARGEPVSMRDLIRAVAREYRKLGRLCLPQEFGEWFHVIDEIDDGAGSDGRAGTPAEEPLAG